MFYGTLRGVGSTGAAVWRRLAPFDVIQFFEWAVAFLVGMAKFLENVGVLVVGPKSVSLKTSTT